MENIATANALLLFGALLLLLGIVSSLIARRFGAPLLLIFLVIGMLAGEDGPGGVVFNDYRLTYLIGSMALAIILFDGGLRTRLTHLKGTIAPATTLATLGVIFTSAIVGVAAVVLLQLNWLQALLLGAVVASTDAAAVFFLLQSGGLELKRRIVTVLETESGTNDPAAVILTLLLVEMIEATNAIGPFEIVKILLMQTVIGAGFGLLGGYAMSITLNRVSLPGGLHPLLAIAGAVMVYALTAVLEGSGFLAVYLAGLVLGNRPLRASASIITVNDALTWLAQIGMFLVLGLLITPSRMLDYAVPALIISAVLMFVARPAAVFLCLAPFGFKLKEKTFISWVGLRGAVSIFLAAIPILSGMESAQLYFNIAFFVVLISLVMQGWTINSAAKLLGLALPRKGALVHRVELDIPGQLGVEMVGYPVHADSAVMNGAKLPEWAQPAFVVRDQAVQVAKEAGKLRNGDYAYFMAPPEKAATLDQLFAHHAELLTHDDPFFGEFIFDGTSLVSDLARLYGLEVETEKSDATLADVFATQFADTPQVGDQIPAGTATLVVKELDGERVKRAGLHLNM
ncbi:MAG: potassium/proton antiporter [Rhodospirillaceae bacterium]|nr:potassium/proton antiporter [Rhodospirillaceae bacterium]